MRGLGIQHRAARHDVVDEVLVEQPRPVHTARAQRADSWSPELVRGAPVHLGGELVSSGRNLGGLHKEDLRESIKMIIQISIRPGPGGKTPKYHSLERMHPPAQVEISEAEP